ncbi:MAG: polymerase subunit sigma-70 [Xanthobacteraceae bacterium]|jgi:RNA polymerase sigma factor (sigma-70 family)|nr:polymerase subunit sigma-70 [Xanthobacteraceae bacterium]
MRERDMPAVLYASHRAALVAYATPILGSREAAEDVVQDAFLKFAPAAPAADGTERGLGYLYRIVRNLALDALKRRKVEVRVQQDEPPFWVLPQELATPEQHAVLGEEVRVVARIMAELPMEVRIAVEMHRFGGHTLEEVAAHLGVSVATAHRHVRSALMRIAAGLDRHGA